MFVLTSCDTVSYYYRKSKNAILERALKQKVPAVELLSDLGEPSLRDARRKPEKICPDVCLWYECSDVCSNILPLTVQKQPPEVFCEKSVHKNFAVFTRKHLCWSLFLRKLPKGLKACNFDKKRPQHRSEHFEILKNTYIEKHLQAVASACQKICVKRYSAAPLRTTSDRYS